MEQFKKVILKDRYSVLLTTLIVYLCVVVVEGVATGREARVIDLENPFFDLNIQDWEEFQQNRSADEIANTP